MGCVEVETHRNRDGYGVGELWVGGMKGGRFSLLQHRVAYEQNWGPVPPGLLVRHSCDNPPCINPLHLMVGTHDDNMNDVKVRGTARRSHCKRGHLIDGVTTLKTGGLQRFCKTCARASKARSREKRKAA